VSRPKVAIVGSIDEARDFEPPVTDPAIARRACEEFGRELAAAGWDIVVYSAKAMFIEADFVRGYVSADTPAPGSIHVHAPLRSCLMFERTPVAIGRSPSTGPSPNAMACS
jgi:hypothetical protein